MGQQVIPEDKLQLFADDADYPAEDVLEFRLTYEGELRPATNKDPRATHKHEIRKILHRQLKSLWEMTPHLKESIHPHPNSYNVIGDFKFEKRLDYLSKNYVLGDYCFAPLVTEDLSLWCGVDILFLRPSPPGKAIQSGDIDNRIKTLFDAFKRPTQMEQLGTYKDKLASPDERPFFCLLEDDALVAKVSVETDTLLEPLSGGIPSEHDARLVITVRIRPATVMLSNMGFV